MGDPRDSLDVGEIQAWTTARILRAKGGDAELDGSRFDDLGRALAKSTLFGGGHLTWHQEFFPLMFDVPADFPRKPR